MMKKIFIFLIGLVFVFLASGSSFALSQDKWFTINTDSVYYRGSASACNSVLLSLLSPNSGGSSSIWQSNVQPPYYVESFVINVLEDIASKLNIPQSNVVTQQHVLALVAWAYLEAGNIRNTFYFNLWNTSYSQPGLLALVQSPGSFPTYASFDAGVEAAAVTMTGSYQNRIGTVLADPSSTATQVLNTVAFPLPNYPSNLGWDTSSTPQQYDNELIQVLSQTENNYPSYASIEIGPGQTNQFNHVPVSELQFATGQLSQNQTVNNPNSGTSSSGSGNGGCLTSSAGSSCGVDGQTIAPSSTSSILCEAVKYEGIYYSWDGGHDYTAFRQGCPESSISSAAASSTATSPGPCATDCSGLVSVAVDAVYNQNYSMTVSTTTGQMEGGGSQYWQPVNLNQVQAGDVATHYGNTSNGPDGHVEIVVSYNQTTGILTTFGSHESKTKTGTDTSNGSTYYTQFYRWMGPTN